MVPDPRGEVRARRLIVRKVFLGKGWGHTIFDEDGLAPRFRDHMRLFVHLSGKLACLPFSDSVSVQLLTAETHSMDTNGLFTRNFRARLLGSEALGFVVREWDGSRTALSEDRGRSMRHFTQHRLHRQIGELSGLALHGGTFRVRTTRDVLSSGRLGLVLRRYNACIGHRLTSCSQRLVLLVSRVLLHTMIVHGTKQRMVLFVGSSKRRLREASMLGV